MMNYVQFSIIFFYPAVLDKIPASNQILNESNLLTWICFRIKKIMHIRISDQLDERDGRGVSADGSSGTEEDGPEARIRFSKSNTPDIAR